MRFAILLFITMTYTAMATGVTTSRRNVFNALQTFKQGVKLKNSDVTIQSEPADGTVKIIIKNGDQSYELKVDGSNNDVFQFTDATDSVDFLTVTTAGLVGIGTTAPTENVVIADSSGNVNVTLEADDTTDDSNINFSDGAIAGGITYDHGSNSLSFITAAAPAEANADLIVDATGQVGIGVTVPAGTLDVQSTISGFVVTVQNNLGADAGGGMHVDTRWNTAANVVAKFTTNSGGTPVFTMLGDGNSGFGMLTPLRDVHITDVMRLEPRSSAPSSPSTGDIYIQDIDPTGDVLCVYLDGAWVEAGGSGTCS